MNLKRWPALVLIPLLLVGAVAFDQRGGTERDRRQAAVTPSPFATPEPGEATDLLPVAAPAGSLQSTWYCAGGTAEEDGGANHTVVIANPTDRPITGVATIFPGVEDPVVQPIEVGARRRANLTLSEVVDAPWAAALIELRGPGAVVEHAVSGSLDSDTAPCVTAPSDRWYFASGATTRDADETLVFFNPYPREAVVDVAFVTDDGRRRPQAFNPVQVPARSVRAMSVTDQVTVRRVVAAAVTVRGGGRIVVDRLQTFDGEGTVEDRERREAAEEAEDDGEEAGPAPVLPAGITITPGVPRPAETWFFPDGGKLAGFHEQIVVYNPTDRDAEVDVALTLEDPRRNGTVEPFELSLAPRTVSVLDMDEETRVPSGVAHSITVAAINGVPVVAERVVAADGRFLSRGTTASTGSPVLATTWLFAAGGANDTVDERIVLQNPTRQPTTATIRILDEGSVRRPPELADIRVPALGRASVTLGRFVELDTAPLVVESEEPLVVERATFRPEGRGMANSIGVPLPAGVTLPPS